MTSTLSPRDTGDIVRPDWTRERGEQTQPIPPRSPLSRPDLADTEVIPLPVREFLVLPEFEGPQRPVPKPTPPPRPSVAPLERVAEPDETAVRTLLAEPVLRRSVPYVVPESHRRSKPKHRRPSLLAVAWARFWGAL